MTEVYSKEIDKIVKKRVDEEFKNKVKPKNVDYLKVDPPIPKQNHFCVSFCPPKRTVLEEAETMCFTYFIAESVKREELIELLQRQPPISGDEEVDNIEKQRFLENTFMEFMEHYGEYKKEHKVLLRNRLKDHFGPEVRVDYAFKVRGAFKNKKKAHEHAKEVSDIDGFPVFVGDMGAWMPFNPSKFTVEHYDSANDKMNDLIRGYHEEREKAERAFGLRKDLLYRQGTKLAEEIKAENEKAIESGEFGDSENPKDPWDGKRTSVDVPLTQIDDWKENPETPDPNMIEIDMLAPPLPPEGKTKMESIEEKYQKAAEEMKAALEKND